jgi:hypothetical protein
MSSAPLCEIAGAVNRLTFDVRDPDKFFEERRRIVRLLKAAATPPTCATCPVNNLRFQLDQKRREAAWEARRRVEAEVRAEQAEHSLEAAQRALDEAVRMLRNAPKPRRRGKAPIEGQLALFEG